MTDNDFNTIKAVENLQNVAGLTPTGQRQERKRRPNSPRRDQESREAPPDKATAECDSDLHRIDYRA